MRTNYILIDYENVQVKSLALLKGEHFRVIVFLGPNNTKLPVDLVIAIQELGERGEYVIMETPGANALDFHIAYYLGLLSKDDPTGFFHIISKDTGFDSLITHLKTKKIFSVRSSSIEEMPCFITKESPLPLPGEEKEIIHNPQSAPGNNTLQELVKTAINDLIKRKASKPRTSKTLINTIHAKCGKDLPSTKIEAVFKKMQQLGYIQVNGTKVAYTLPADQL